MSTQNKWNALSVLIQITFSHLSSLSLSSIHIRPKWPFLPAHTATHSTYIPANKRPNSAYLPTNTEPNTLNTALKHAYMDSRDCYYLLISGTYVLLSVLLSVLPILSQASIPSSLATFLVYLSLSTSCIASTRHCLVFLLIWMKMRVEMKPHHVYTTSSCQYYFLSHFPSLQYLIILVSPLSPSLSSHSPSSLFQDFYFTGVPANFSEYDMQYWQFVDASGAIVSAALGLTPMDKYTFNRYVFNSVDTPYTLPILNLIHDFHFFFNFL